MKNETKTKIKNILESKSFRAVIYTLGALVLAFMIFQAGSVSGFRKASFGRDWGKNYDMNFGSPHRGPGMMGGEFGDFGNLPNAHGAIGKIIKIELPNIIVQDEKDNTEKVIVINKDTQIRKVRDQIAEDGLKVDDSVVIIGAPNSSGQIEARLIRILPAPFDMPIKTQ